MKDGVTKLGPGVRFAVWTQGCLRRCPGCMTPESRPVDGGYPVSTQELAEKILSSGREGVTISGGEPFLQAEAVTEMIRFVRKKTEIGVIIYTGYTLEELKDSGDESFLALLEECDLLVDGAYVEALNDGKNLRGSSNQRAIALTERYKDQVSEYGARPAEVEFFYSEETFSMVGIPSKSLLEQMKKIKI